MAKMIAHIHAKAKAFVDSLEGMPRGAPALTPRGHFARDYNTLRKLALDAEPELDERLLGKYVRVRNSASGEEVSEASFIEIEVYARQIMEQMALLLPSGDATLSSEGSGRNCRELQPPPKASKPWSRVEDDELVAAFDAGRPVRELAKAHDRTDGAIRSRLMRLGKLKPETDGDVTPTADRLAVPAQGNAAAPLSSPQRAPSADSSTLVAQPGEATDWDTSESSIPVRPCARCGWAIPPERLEAIPEADLCVNCQLGRESEPSNPRITNYECPRCSNHGISSLMVWRTARDPSISGYFLGCSRFPECRYVDRS